jgi:hypothetical protein
MDRNRSAEDFPARAPEEPEGMDPAVRRQLIEQARECRERSHRYRFMALSLSDAELAARILAYAGELDAHAAKLERDTLADG